MSEQVGKQIKREWKRSETTYSLKKWARESKHLAHISTWLSRK